MIDLSRIKTAEDLLALQDDGLYDESPEYGENPYEVQLNPLLTPEEVKDAMFWAKYSRGIMLVTGAAGAGKGLLANMVAWKMKYYFSKTALLDYRPRRLFGPYHPFNETVLVEQLSRMTNIAEGSLSKEVEKNEKKANPMLQNLTREWIASQGKVFLQNSVLVLDEFKRYAYKRRPSRAIGLVLSELFDLWRHMDILIIGIAIERKELDRFWCLPKLTTEVRCQWLSENAIQKYDLAPYSCLATLYPLRYTGIAGEGILEVSSRPKKIIVEGGKPRECLGGKRWVDLYNTKDAKIIQPPTSMLKAVKQ